MQASSFCRLALAVWLGLAAPAQAASLAEAFDRAWAARQAVSEARQQLRDSQREASDAWLPGPPALTASRARPRDHLQPPRPEAALPDWRQLPDPGCQTA